MKIKIIGCGSAGNHMAFAFKKIAKHITMTDTSDLVLLRSKNQIYKKRYKSWDKKIHLKNEAKDTNNYYDLIIISTPPISHSKLVKKNILKSDNFLIEKPLCAPNKKDVNFFKKIIKKFPNKNFYCGYNHRLFPSTIMLKNILKFHKNQFDNISVHFKENNVGFLKAHHWMKTLDDSYLSNSKEGGGALCEHSHALNLAEFFIDNPKDLKIIDHTIKYSKNKFRKKFDTFVDIKFKAKNKLVKICQNFETYPTEKRIEIFSKNFFAELTYNYKNNDDKIFYYNYLTNKKKYFYFRKKRSDDFLYEAQFLKNKITKKIKKNDKSIDMISSINTMDLILKLI